MIPFSIGVACGLTIMNKFLCEKRTDKFSRSDNYKKRAQQTINSSDKISRKILQDISIDNGRVWFFLFFF